MRGRRATNAVAGLTADAAPAADPLSAEWPSPLESTCGVCSVRWGWIPLWIVQTRNSLRGDAIRTRGVFEIRSLTSQESALILLRAPTELDQFLAGDLKASRSWVGAQDSVPRGVRMPRLRCRWCDSCGGGACGRARDRCRRRS